MKINWRKWIPLVGAGVVLLYLLKKAKGENGRDGDNGVNMVLNGSFDNGLEGWHVEYTPAEAEVSALNTGTIRGNVLYINNFGGYPVVVQQTVPVQPNQKLRVEVLVKVETVKPLKFGLHCGDQAPYKLIPPSALWDKVTVDIDLPADAYGCQILFRSSSIGKVYVDDVKMYVR